jgi:hypothetical protein
LICCQLVPCARLAVITVWNAFVFLAAVPAATTAAAAAAAAAATLAPVRVLRLLSTAATTAYTCEHSPCAFMHAHASSRVWLLFAHFAFAVCFLGDSKRFVI